MSQEQVGRLQGLLARIQQNAARPRVSAAAVAQPAPEETTLVQSVEEEDTAEQLIPVLPEAPRVAVSAEVPEQAPELEVMEVELGEEEIVDITDLEDIQELEDAPSVGLELAHEDEPPASSRRPIAANMSEALAGAADSVDADDDREIPLKTPPPESGPQAAPPSQGATTEIDELIGEPILHPPPPQHAVVDEHAPSGVIEVAERVEPQIVARSASATAQVSAIIQASRSFQPQSFAELLDASLGLGS